MQTTSFNYIHLSSTTLSQSAVIIYQIRCDHVDNITEQVF